VVQRLVAELPSLIELEASPEWAYWTFDVFGKPQNERARAFAQAFDTGRRDILVEHRFGLVVRFSADLQELLGADSLSEILRFLRQSGFPAKGSCAPTRDALDVWIAANKSTTFLLGEVRSHINDLDQEKDELRKLWILHEIEGLLAINLKPLLHAIARYAFIRRAEGGTPSLSNFLGTLARMFTDKADKGAHEELMNGTRKAYKASYGLPELPSELAEVLTRAHWRLDILAIFFRELRRL
jgi:hypothetical protein